MRHLRLPVLSVLTALALSACAAEPEERPELEMAAPFRIEDRSSEAPPTPPPSAPPEGALAMPSAPQPPAEPPPARVAAPSPSAAPPAGPAPPPVSEAPPDSAQWVRESPGGHWVYADGYGWMWVPANAASVDDEGVPYTYLYTPTYGWTWYVSPWGPGPYRYGAWVRRPWHPAGWHGAWVAGPRVTVRFGGHPHAYSRRHRR